MLTLPLYQNDETLWTRAATVGAAAVCPAALTEANRILFKQAQLSSIVVVTTETIF